MKRIRQLRPALAVDFQGLIQSAVIGRLSRPQVFWGFDKSIAREPLASMFYTCRAIAPGPHRIERNLQLAQAAGATRVTDQAWLPAGRDEGDLPTHPFALAAPFAGWVGKEWPLAYYESIGRLLSRQGLSLVLNIAPRHGERLQNIKNVHLHTSSIAGLIYAIRRATAVIGVDSGPLHIAAALRKPGVAIFGPTDPAANGPYGGTIDVIRSAAAETTYRRHKQVQSSMRSITPERVFDTLMRSVARKHAAPGLSR